MVSLDDCETGALGGSVIIQPLQWVTPRVRDLSPFERKRKLSPLPAPKLLPKYVEKTTSRHGKTVYYFRRDKQTPRIRLRSDPGAEGFLLEVANARDGKTLPSPASWVYFVLCGERVKIGISKNPRRRLSGLRTGSSRLLRLFYVTPGDMELERELHRQFGADRVNGEWFIYSQQIRDWIQADEAGRKDLEKHIAKSVDDLARLTGKN